MGWGPGIRILRSSSGHQCITLESWAPGRAGRGRSRGMWKGGVEHPGTSDGPVVEGPCISRVRSSVASSLLSSPQTAPPHQATSQGSWALVILQEAGCGRWPFGVVKGGEGKAFNLKQEGPNQNQLKVHHYYCHKRSSGSWEGHSLAHSSPCLLSLLPVVWLDPHGLVQPIKARRYLGVCP